MQKTNQKEFRIEEVIKRKGDKLYFKSKGYDNCIKILYKISQYFPKPYEPFRGDINVKVDLSSYATKADLKNPTGIDTSGFALKSNLASLKAKVYEIDVEKLKMCQLI